MTLHSRQSPEADVESLLASERVLVASPHGTRDRALSRARAALQGGTGSPHVWRASRSSYPARRFIKLLAIPTALGASWALAHQAGYRLPDWDSGSAPAADAPLADAKGAKPPESTDGAESPAVVVSQAQTSSAVAEAVAKEAEPRPNEPRAAASPGEKSEVDAYTQELRVLQPAQRFIARRDFAAALDPISEHRKLFAFGVLAEEREALRIKALVGLGRQAEARQVAATFRKRFPKSALQGRVDALLGIEK
jgi:hypothetical protein